MLIGKEQFDSINGANPYHGEPASSITWGIIGRLRKILILSLYVAIVQWTIVLFNNSKWEEQHDKIN